jgi:hypothetical protein
MELAFSIYDLIDVCIQVIQCGYCTSKTWHEKVLSSGMNDTGFF